MSDKEWDLPPVEPTDIPGDAPDDQLTGKALYEEVTQQQREWASQPAPYGRFKSGKPRKTPPKGGAKAPSAKRSVKGQVNYEEGVSQLLQTVAFGLTMLGTNNKAFLADGLIVAHHAPNIAGAIGQLANERPEVAAVLDRILAVGPYGVLIGAVVPLFMQAAANHGARIPGTATADELLADAEKQYQMAQAA